MFHLNISSRKTEWQCTLNILMMHGAVGANTNLPIQNVWAIQQISPKIVLTFECGDGETIYIHISFCIIYPGKHNGTILLTYEARNKQLVQKQILDQTTTVPQGYVSKKV